MSNPMLQKKDDPVYTLTPYAKKLFQAVYKEKQQGDATDESPKIAVSDLVSKMAFYYEKIRNSVDYKEEYLLRKNAIERILKRLVTIEGVLNLRERKGREVAVRLLTELIRAAYLPNNKVPEAKIDEIGAVIDRYLVLRRYALERTNGLNHNDRNELSGWIFALCASDIEERLGKGIVTRVQVNYLFDVLTRYVELPANSPYADDRDVQLFLGIHRCLFKFDREMLGFILFRYYNEGWQDADDAKVAAIGRNIGAIRAAIDRQLDHPLQKPFDRIINRYTVFFSILTDVIREDPVGTYESISRDPKAFPRLIKQAAERRYKTARRKLRRAATRSIVYIFLTKGVFAALIEIPATQFFGEQLNALAIGVNVSFPAFLLFLIVILTKLPGEDNTQKIVEGVNEVVFVEFERKDPYRLRAPAKRGAGLSGFFAVLYLVFFAASVSATVYVLLEVGFSFVSIIIFLFFLAFVSFFGIRIRRVARELIIVSPRENLLSLLSDFFYIPIVSAGKFLSERFSRINVFVFILDFIIEAPFKVFVKIAEDWTNYVRERKDDIV